MGRVRLSAAAGAQGGRESPRPTFWGGDGETAQVGVSAQTAKSLIIFAQGRLSILLISCHVPALPFTPPHERTDPTAQVWGCMNRYRYAIGLGGVKGVVHDIS